jgi:hypothetical protein
MWLMCDTHMKLQLCIGGKVVHQQLNKLRGVSLLGILQECGELGRVYSLGSLSPRKSVIP